MADSSRQCGGRKLLRKLSALILAAGLLVGLTACVSYDEVYGKVVGQDTRTTTSMILVGKVMVPQTRTKYYLTVEYTTAEGTFQEEWSVAQSGLETCPEGNYIFREENGNLTCSDGSFR